MPTHTKKEASRRRTFAIISHPDAGKTTLTEKLLLYGGAIQSAGAVKARSAGKKATSDWMELEKQRGISVTSTVLQFEYGDHVLNLLDTPGHNDFSADTYRTLTAADSAVMVIDFAKGVEPQTTKLFAVCKQRGTPIFTFVNKLDHDGLGPVEILENIEKYLGLTCVPVNWPIGDGIAFQGIYVRDRKEVVLYQRVARGSTKATQSTVSLNDPDLPELIGQAQYDKLIEDIELLDIATEPLTSEGVLTGRISPMYFGSALTNFGVDQFLDSFIQMAPSPETVETVKSDEFSAFVFKIQANMNPDHRDRIAFLRVVSGKFEKDMDVTHVNSKKAMKLTRPVRIFGSDRETILEAFPGDIIGIPNPGFLRLGDTLSTDPALSYDRVPQFVPELFASVMNNDTTKFKQYEKGIEQLAEEGLVNLFLDATSSQRQYVLGAVGELQFDVVTFRMKTEYNIDIRFQRLPHPHIRWFDGNEGELNRLFFTSDVKRLRDLKGRLVLLFSSPFQITNFETKLTESRLLGQQP